MPATIEKKKKPRRKPLGEQITFTVTPETNGHAEPFDMCSLHGGKKPPAKVDVELPGGRFTCEVKHGRLFEAGWKIAQGEGHKEGRTPLVKSHAEAFGLAVGAACRWLDTKAAL